MNTEYLYDVLDQEKVDIANNNKLLEEEIDGLDVHEHGCSAYADFNFRI